jgi:L-fuculose-phosphate aldolase
MAAEKKVSAFEAKKVIVDIGLKCWLKGWVASNDGNISWRIGEDEILCTPTGVSKGMLTPEHICVVDMDGTVRARTGNWKPSSEIKMHLRVLRERPDIRSVFHAHPPYATAHAIAGIPLAECVVPEIVIGLGSVPIAPYGTPSTSEIPDRLAPLIKDYDVWLLENHGALSAGVEPYQAFFRMESLELYAKMMFIAKSLGRVNALDTQKVQALVNLRTQFGIANKNNVCTGCGACGKPRTTASSTACCNGETATAATETPVAPSMPLSDPALIETIVKRVKEALGV